MSKECVALTKLIAAGKRLLDSGVSELTITQMAMESDVARSTAYCYRRELLENFPGKIISKSSKNVSAKRKLTIQLEKSKDEQVRLRHALQLLANIHMNSRLDILENKFEIKLR